MFYSTVQQTKATKAVHLSRRNLSVNPIKRSQIDHYENRKEPKSRLNSFERFLIVACKPLNKLKPEKARNKQPKSLFLHHFSR